jgi:two-component system sensor histidine kinase KdpD
VGERFAAALEFPRPTRATLPIGAVALASIVVATLVIAALETWTAIPDASAVYLVAVVIAGSIGGTWPALATAIGSFVVYDILFTEPRFSLVVADPVELLNLVLVLIVALAIGRLAALGREHATEADRRATEATASFAISRLIATADSTGSILPVIAERLTRDVPLDRVWVTLETPGNERTIADSGSGPLPATPVVTTLVRMPGDEPAHWVRAHDPSARRDGAAVGSGAAGASATARARASGTTATLRGRAGSVIRVKMETAGMLMGSLWGSTSRPATGLDPAGTRLMSLAADQIALALRRDRLRDDAVRAEVARRNDAFKSALLDSVSHDLRTPLASIRATAGNLADPASASTPEQVQAGAESIDAEVERLDRLVRSVLDLSRIGSGTLAPDVEVHDLAVLVDAAVGRARQALEPRTVTIAMPDEPPLVLVDAVFLDTALANVLDNIARHTPPATRVEVSVSRPGPGRVVLVIEDDGPGVAREDLARIFERFQRGTAGSADSRHGMGIGLSIVRGMTEGMGGTVTAARSRLGGLAVTLDLPAAPAPPADEPA